MTISHMTLSMIFLRIFSLIETFYSILFRMYCRRIQNRAEPWHHKSKSWTSRLFCWIIYRSSHDLRATHSYADGGILIQWHIQSLERVRELQPIQIRESPSTITTWPTSKLSQRFSMRPHKYAFLSYLHQMFINNPFEGIQCYRLCD